MTTLPTFSWRSRPLWGLALWELDPETGVLWLSPEAEALFGFAGGDFDGRGQTAMALVHPDDRRRLRVGFLRAARSDGNIALELRIVRPDGSYRWVEARGGIVAGSVQAQFAGVVSDVTDRVVRDRQQQLVGEASRILGETLDLESTLDRIPALVAPELADRCSIVFEPQASSPPPGVAARVPLAVHGRVIGALELWNDDGRAPAPDDLEIVREIAARAAVAIDNARLHEAEQDASADAERTRLRMSRHQAVTEALSEALTRADVAEVLLREGSVALLAQGGAVFELTDDGSAFEALGINGYPDPVVSAWERLDAAEPGPVAEAVRTGGVVAVESPEELLARWPDQAELLSLAGDCALVVAPLLASDRAVGALQMAFRQPRTFDEADLAVVRTLARQCAQALERARLYEEAEDARKQAERLAGRLRRLLSVVDATFITGSLDEILHELLLRLRDAIESDTATILIVDETGEALVVRDAVGFDGPIETRVPIGAGFAGRIAATQTHQVVEDISMIDVVSAYLRESGLQSLAGVPLIADGRLVGVAHVGSKRRRHFDREDVLLLRLIAARAAVAIDRFQVHEREHQAAEVFQRSLLPERLPSVDGVEIAARYVPGTIGYTVGGDWYDVFELSDGSIGIAVGDVVGHGVRAAATMGRLRNVLRAYALEGFGPADALCRLNVLACDGSDETFATVVYAVIAPTRTRLRLATAGHPPVLVRRPDRSVHTIEGGRALPIGAAEGTHYTEIDVRIEPGSALVLYTDGLVERRAESIDTGIARLTRLLENTSGSLDLLADSIVAELESTDHTDDVALLALQLEPLALPRLSLSFPADPQELAPMRSSLRSWLEGHGAADDEIFDILVAVNEACSNAVEHPLGRAHPDVRLEAEVVDSELSIVIHDEGRWRPSDARGDRGRGLEFMSALMEDVDVRRSTDGTTVHLTRRLERSR